MKVEAVINTNISESCSDTNLFPFKLASDVPLDCWPHNHLHYFTELVALAVLRQNYLGSGKNTYKQRQSKIMTFRLRLILEIGGKTCTSSLIVSLEKSYGREIQNKITISKYVQHWSWEFKTDEHQSIDRSTKIGHSGSRLDLTLHYSNLLYCTLLLILYSTLL